VSWLTSVFVARETLIHAVLRSFSVSFVPPRQANVKMRCCRGSYASFMMQNQLANPAVFF